MKGVYKIISAILFLSSVIELKAQDTLRFGPDIDGIVCTEWKLIKSDDRSLIYADPVGWEVIKNNNCDDIFDQEGIFTLSKFIYVDSSVIGKPCSVSLYHFGASEVYLDGKQLATYGKISETRSGEVALNPIRQPVIICFMEPGFHRFVVRCSNNYASIYKTFLGLECNGFDFILASADKAVVSNLKHDSLFANGFMIVLGVLISLTFLHLLIYFFYRTQKSNLYYSVFAGSFALLIMMFELNFFSENPLTILLANYFRWRLLLVVFYFLLLLLFSVLNVDIVSKWRKRVHWISAIVIIPLLVYPHLSSLFIFILMTSYITGACTLTGFLLGKARKQHIAGLKIIGYGLSVFIYFAGLYFVASGILHVDFTESTWKGVLAFIALILGILSIPISMSVYLAWSFSNTNKSLADKLIEVERLSALTIEQERQKKKILEEQNDELDRQVKIRTAEVVAKSEELEEKNKEIIDSINYAKRIQQTLLAHDEFLNKHLPEHFVYFNPKDIVSGDFYWAAAQGEKFYLAVCDSTGHGVPGAFMSLLNIGFLTEAINEKEIYDPAQVFNFCRKRLIENVSKDGQKDGFDGILICIEKSSSKITYAAAHNAPILIRDNQILQLESDRMPVGFGERRNDFNHYEIDVQKGDVLYLYTDGYADQFGGLRGKKFKYKQLNELLLELHKNSLEEQHEAIKSTFANWKGDLEQVDDVCVIGLRF